MFGSFVPSIGYASRHVRVALAPILLALACQTQSQPPTKPPEPAPPATVEIDVDDVRKHLTFLADDAQQGRAPGSAADRRVQEYLADTMRQLTLEPAFESSFRQPFMITDGVRLRSGEQSRLEIGGKPIEHALVPFTTPTKAKRAITAPLVFVGYGIAGDEPGSGDYKGLERRVKGAIVVALHGAPPDDPHVPIVKQRPQSKLIAARDHEAAGFILWDPLTEFAYPNHGEASDLFVPAVQVGTKGSAGLAAAFGLSGEALKNPAKALTKGAKSKRKAKLATPVERVELQTANVAGILRGGDPSGGLIVLGAHMDHLGMGTSSSLAPGEQAIHNGADDNASGVAVILSIARALRSRPADKRPYDVMFVAFGAEEMGLLGSKHLVRTLEPKRKDRIVAMLNFDMVGRLSEGTLIVAGTGTSSVWTDLIEQTRGELTVRATEDGYGPSDHGSFYEIGIPVLHFFTGPHTDYHKPTDDLDKINFEGAAEVGSMALRVVEDLLDGPIKPDYIKVKRPERGSRAFRVSLGTIPDYGANVDGLRLSGVREGGAAAQAGLQKGDVIKKIGDREVHNIDDFMATFGTMKAGETVKFVVERDGKPLEIDVVPAAPRPR